PCLNGLPIRCISSIFSPKTVCARTLFFVLFYLLTLQMSAVDWLCTKPFTKYTCMSNYKLNLSHHVNGKMNDKFESQLYTHPRFSSYVIKPWIGVRLRKRTTMKTEACGIMPKRRN
ncbi:hypothetical protein L9F63_004410, partial [Diploptera punctata]